MKAARFSGHGGPEVIHYEDVGEPDIGPADVIVRVAACAVNRLDVLQRSARFTLPGFRLPHIAGMDVAGVVVELGSQARGVAIGERVVINPSLTDVAGNSRFAGLDDRYGRLGVIGATVDGGYAEYCAAPASHVHVIPAAISLEHRPPDRFQSTLRPAGHGPATGGRWIGLPDRLRREGIVHDFSGLVLPPGTGRIDGRDRIRR